MDPNPIESSSSTVVPPPTRKGNFKKMTKCSAFAGVRKLAGRVTPGRNFY
jgi:hypothetical protein